MDYDFIAIGDTVTDAFIRLDLASAHIDIDHGVSEICMHFGAKVPYDDVYVISGVGNSANAACAASRLGLKTALVANIGDDDYGRQILQSFDADHIATEFVRVHSGKRSNYHYVLWYKDERTILIKHEEYEYALPDIGSPKWLYLSSLGRNSLPFHKVLLEYLELHPKIKLAFQPGTYQIEFGKEALAGIYKRTDLFFCDKEEAKRILGTNENNIKKLVVMIGAIGPKMVAITDGPVGALAFDGTNTWFIPPYPDSMPPLQRTGAGDAFSSTVTVALALGVSFEEALRWGPVNSMSVVQHIGARTGLLTREALESYLAKAPSEYQLRRLGTQTGKSTLGEILLRATNEGWSTGHFNVSESDQVRAVCEAAAELGSVAIIGTSEGEAEHLGRLEAVALRDAMRQELGIPIFLNADHHKSVASAKAAIDAGYDSVHIDLSAKSYEENIAGTSEIVRYARKTELKFNGFKPKISIEGELGSIGGESKIQNQKINIKPEDYTNSAQAKEFVERTGIDRLAIAVGNAHGIWLDEKVLDIHLISKIRDLIPPQVALVLHAGSGISDEQICAAIKAGIANIHINTDMRLAYSQALRTAFFEHPEETTPYKFDIEPRESVKKVVLHKLRLFGSAYKI